jgi:hypothetical protein
MGHRIREPRQKRNHVVTPVKPELARHESTVDGQAIDRSTRDYFESRFGHDFSRVRIYSDSQSAASSRDIGARAYTSGQNIYFSEGQYQPETEEGLRLLGHELTHVVQQENGEGLSEGVLEVSSPSDASEREARTNGERILSGEPVHVQNAAPPSIQGDWLDDITKGVGFATPWLAPLLGAEAAPWVAGPVAAGLGGAHLGRYLEQDTSVGEHAQSVLGGFDAMMTEPGERSWMLRQTEEFDEAWDQGDVLGVAGNALQIGGAGLVGALGGIGGGIVDAAGWLGDKTGWF